MKSIFLFIVLVFGMNSLVAQSKKDLLTEIDRLRSEVSSAKTELSESQRKIRISETKVESMKEQVESVKATNESLLTNMGNFTQLSQQKSKNLEQSLETIKKKDEQLSIVNKALAKVDSVKLATYELFKMGLKEPVDKAQAKLNFKDGVIHITATNEFLFGLGSGITVKENAKNLLSKIGLVLNKTPDLNIHIEGNSNELTFANGQVDNWDLSSLQASAIARSLQTEFSVEPKRIQVVGKSQYASESIETSTTIVIAPIYSEFFNTVKDIMKN